MTVYSRPSPDRFVRDMTTFIRNPDGSWRRGDERHVNVLIDTARVPKRLAEHGVDATVAPALGPETLPAGLVAVIGRRRRLASGRMGVRAGHCHQPAGRRNPHGPRRVPPVEVAASNKSRTRVRASYLRSKGPQYMDVRAPRR
jgi:hypothetical protein